MRIFRIGVTTLFATAAAGVIACSSEPAAQTTNDESDLVVIHAACWQKSPPLGCSTAQARDQWAVDPGKTLMWTYGCQTPSSYDVPQRPCCEYPDGGAVIREWFTVCPNTTALHNWIGSLSPYSPTTPRMNDQVCNSCLPPAAAGKIYVVWGSQEFAEPLCSGGCPRDGWW